jgi:uncharacterized glyoxalase superfamily protein PhnB
MSEQQPESEHPTPTIWPALRYDDAPGAVRFLVDVFGFREHSSFPEREVMWRTRSCAGPKAAA